MSAASAMKIERASVVYDRRGEDLGKLYVLNRTPVKIEKVPAVLVQALTAEEVGTAAAFLASPLAGGITGSTVYVDKGYNIMGMAVDSTAP